MVKGEKTIAQMVSEYEVCQWKEHLLSVLLELFSDWMKRTNEEGDQVKAELYRQIEQLEVENKWFKKYFNRFNRREEADGREG